VEDHAPVARLRDAPPRRRLRAHDGRGTPRQLGRHHPGLPQPIFAGAEGPQLTAPAVFVGSAFALFALGIFA
jgi:hypothetical protein